MKFLESIQAGVAKAEASDLHIREVADLFIDLNRELSIYTDGKLKLSRKATRPTQLDGVAAFMSVLAPQKTPTEFMPSDRLELTTKNGDRVFAEIARWRQHVNGFPCTISFEGQEYICNSIDDLSSALGLLLASVSFGKQLQGALMELKSTSRGS
jgi:hypothetical protein